MRRGFALAFLVGLASVLPVLRGQDGRVPPVMFAGATVRDVDADAPGATLVPRRDGVRVVARRAATPAGEVAVSRATRPQAEVAVTIDPGNPNVLLAGSASQSPAPQVYGSVDGGVTWTSDTLPQPGELCGYGDPAVAIGVDGQQFFAFLAGPCSSPTRISLAMATRTSAGGSWTTRVLSIAGENQLSDKEALAVDTSSSTPHRGRLYLAWSRRVQTNSQEVVLSHSDDSGVTWSEALKISPVRVATETFASIAIGADGTVYLAWLSSDGTISLARSTDGGVHFEPPSIVGIATELAFRNCGAYGNGIAAQPWRCVTPAPLVTVDRLRSRVYVTYGASGVARREQNVYVASYDEKLEPLLRKRRVNPPEKPVEGDQILPASAVDESTGRLWACWYDTTGSTRRTRVRYTCSASRDGGRTWQKPVPVASVFSDETVRTANRFGYGDYAGVAVAGGVAHPIWTDSRDLATLREEIYASRLELP
jgi:hypothetical protein